MPNARFNNPTTLTSLPDWLTQLLAGTPFGICSAWKAERSVFSNERNAAALLASTPLGVPVWGVTAQWGSEPAVLVVSDNARQWGLENADKYNQQAALLDAGIVQPDGVVDATFTSIDVFPAPIPWRHVRSTPIGDVRTYAELAGVPDHDKIDAASIIPHGDESCWVIVCR